MVITLLYTLNNFKLPLIENGFFGTDIVLNLKGKMFKQNLIDDKIECIYLQIPFKFRN